MFDNRSDLEKDRSLDMQKFYKQQKSVDSCQPARNAQADISQNFFVDALRPPVIEHDTVTHPLKGSCNIWLHDRHVKRCLCYNYLGKKKKTWFERCCSTQK